MKTKNIKPGFYILKNNRGDGDNCLVKVCKGRVCLEVGLVIGFGVWDGAGFMPLSDLKEDSELIPVYFTFDKKRSDYIKGL